MTSASCSGLGSRLGREGQRRLARLAAKLAAPVQLLGQLTCMGSLLLASSACGKAVEQPAPVLEQGSADLQERAQLSVLDLAGQSIHPAASPGDKATVFIFVREDCPISNRYAPEIQRLQASFEGKGVAFKLVYPDPQATAQKIRDHLREYAYAIEALRDPEHALVRWTEVSTTPEVAVLLSDQTLIYRGRIDDQWVEFGRARPGPTSRDLMDVLSAIVDGRALSLRTTPAVGCYISDLK